MGAQNTPWRIDNSVRPMEAIRDSSGGLVGLVRPDDAPLIVTAANAHEAMIDALKHALAWIPEDAPGPRHQILAALALAKGES